MPGQTAVEERAPRQLARPLQILALVLVSAVVGALAGRMFAPAPPPAAQTPARPIVQIVRQQPGVASLADLIDRLCPSAAVIVPSGTTPVGLSPSSATSGDPQTGQPAVAVSADGWLLTPSGFSQGAKLDILFGDGRRSPVSEVRSDAVSGLALVKTDAQLSPIPFEDQTAARVGDSGFALGTLAGSGCSAQAAMIGSDFLADGGGASSYLRLQPGFGDWPDGTPFLTADGHIIGISTGGVAGALIPAPVVALVVDELIRNRPSPTTQFGFRAVDFSQALSARLGDFRSRGAGVTLVQSKSAADRAGLRAGDIVVAVDGSPVSSASELGRALDGSAGPVTLDIRRTNVQLQLRLRQPRT